MSTFDPSAAEIGGTDVLEEELSVEDVVQMETDEISEAEAAADATEELPAEETVTGDIGAAPVPTPIPIKIKRRVSGCYRNCPKPWQLELRVDVDGYRPLKRVSGDFYLVSGATVSYFGSFVVNVPTISITSSQVTIVGLADTTWATSYNKIRVIIPRHTIFQPPANAYMQFMTIANKKGAAYTCNFKSTYFRTMDLEQDHEKGVTPFNSYNTGSLPSGGPARTLSVAKAYAEAGIQMRDSGVSNQVPTAPGSTWSNAELHAAMVKHFSLWEDAPQWKVW
ncbi:hypothetical protein MJD09_08875, partial [bacterium]|nr:hypothetical protein [bacterium]